MGLTEADQPLYEIKANLFKGLAHPFRIRILELLSGAGEFSVAQMLDDMALEASHLSQHLSVLRRHRLVTSQRRGSHVYYRLTSPHGAELLTAARLLLGDLLQVSADQLQQAANMPATGTRAQEEGAGSRAQEEGAGSRAQEEGAGTRAQEAATSAPSPAGGQ